MPRSDPAGISGSHHWINSMLVSEKAALALIAAAKIAADTAVFIFPIFMVFSPDCVLKPNLSEH
jgi:hypothetical protein